MPAQPTLAQSTASRLNGAPSAGPVSDAGKARSALNATRHGLCGRSFFLLPDEDPAEYARHETLWLSTWRPRAVLEREAALTAIRALWREERADRLEVQVLNDLFGAEAIEDEAEAKAVKQAAWRALSTLLRYRARIQREHDRARRELDALRQRPQAGLAAQPAPAPPTQHGGTHEPEPRAAATPVQSKPERP
ncbi:MAG TPA: hypothetical protein VFY87_18240 [Geminicoccaceae bacterium]|nr:hypothetical protein [Geminicoccaceae bacterium]